MKLDLDWPVPPRHGIPLHRQPPPELPASRAFAVEQLNRLAKIAEGEVLPRDVDGRPELLPEERPYRSPEAFVAWCVATLCAEIKDVANADILAPNRRGEAYLSTGAWQAWATQACMEERVLLIERKSFHVVGPIRGDIVVFADGHAAIVTYPQCSGCRHFEVAEFTPRMGAVEVPSVFTSRHWLSTVHAIIRLVFSPKAEPVTSTAPAPKKRARKGASA